MTGPLTLVRRAYRTVADWIRNVSMIIPPLP
jgi:hypothetical protein